MRRFVSALVPGVLAGIATAQTATVDVSHNDPDGIVSPGESVRITVWHTRSGSILAGIGGDVVASGDLGAAANLTTDLFPGSSVQTAYPGTLGTPVGGSVRGVQFEFTSHPAFVAMVSPAYINSSGIEVLSYDWTAPSVAQPTTIDFDWSPSAAFPDVYAIVPPFNELHWAFLPTTYTGTSLIVLPSPATLGVLGLGFFVPRRRR